MVRIWFKCGSTHLTQDPDTLDTWFSSALWPFSTLGWPEKTPEFDYFYPTDVLVTGYDIIFFWVIRMVFSALEQTKQVPFHHVLIHGLVRDSQGRQLSHAHWRLCGVLRYMAPGLIHTAYNVMNEHHEPQNQHDHEKYHLDQELTNDVYE